MGAVSSNRDEAPNGDDHSTEKNGLEAFLGSGLDILVIALPLTPSTTHLLALPQLQLLRPKRTFVSNIARGKIIDTDALITALDQGWIRGAALDVTDPEPLPKGHRLWEMPNVVVTPHVSGNSDGYNVRVLGVLAENLRRLSLGVHGGDGGGGKFCNQVDKGLGY